MLYIWIFSNKFDLKQTKRVLHKYILVSEHFQKPWVLVVIIKCTINS